MIKNKDIICISSIDWDFIWQGHQEIMLTLAKQGNRVLFIENTGVRALGIRDIPRIKTRIKNWLKGIKGIRKEIDNLYIYSPIVFPFPYFRFAGWLNHYLILSMLEKWMKIMNFSNPTIWTFLPTPLSLDLINNINNSIVIYYCIDNFSASSKVAKKIRASEVAIIKKADLVFVTSEELYRYCHAHNDKVYKFPFAVSFQKFEKIRLENNSAPSEVDDIKRPLIGYVGGIHKWVDQKLIKYAAEKYPDFSFIFIGPIQTDISLLSGLKNVYFLGHRDHEDIPFFIKSFDACIIPYQITDYTNNVYPTKLNEYLAMGKPVVSTNLPEVANFNIINDNLVSVGRTYDEFCSSIVAAINTRDRDLIDKRISCAKENSWDVRIEEMVSLIEDELEIKSGERVDWRESFLKLYRTSRKKIIKISVIVCSIYFLFFYTPLIWFLAEPLKFSNLPEKADCIVVFSGGVGESGKAGQGYEERVDYAVKLYKQGYANRIIFSTGYKFVFREAEIMKSLAINLGIPGQDIILEENASNTYENVKFIKEILDKQGWKSVLLISSPYHMARVHLVFNKIAPEIKTIYTPIPISSFYGVDIKHPPKGISLKRQIGIKQIRGFLHEYLGIIYYWFKRYI